MAGNLLLRTRVEGLHDSVAVLDVHHPLLNSHLLYLPLFFLRLDSLNAGLPSFQIWCSLSVLCVYLGRFRRQYRFVNTTSAVVEIEKVFVFYFNLRYDSLDSY